MAWLCGCGNGNLVEKPPEFCGLCGFDLWGYFGIPIEVGDEIEPEEGGEA